MRIIKYLLLLILLFFVGFSVYVATQKPNYEIVRTKFVPIPKATLFDFVKDYQNWEGFNINLEKVNQDIEFSKSSDGLNSFVKWNYPQKGKYQTIALALNDSITFSENLDGQTAIQNWKFKDSIGGTLVRITSKGVLSFQEKVVSFFKGGPNFIVTNILEKTLENLKNTIVVELKTFKLTTTGEVMRPKQYFLKQNIVCREKSVEKNIKNMVPKMLTLVNKNGIKSNGTPFLIFNKYDKINNVVDFSVCIPIQDSVFNATVANLEFSVLESYTAIRTILKGDHNHQQIAWKKTTEYSVKNKYNTNTNVPVIEVLSDYSNPKASQKVTEIFFAVYPKITAPSIEPTQNTAPIKDSLISKQPLEPVQTKPSGNTKIVKPKPVITTKLNSSATIKKVVKPIVTPSKKEDIPENSTDEFGF